MEKFEPTLPPELKEKILFQSSGEDLVALCRSSAEFFQLCSNPVFWKKKFREEELPLPQEGDHSTQRWLNIYSRAFRAKEETERTVQKISQPFSPRTGRPTVTYNIGRLRTPLPLSFLGVKDEVKEIWEKLRGLFLLKKELDSGRITLPLFREESQPFRGYSGIVRINKVGGDFAVNVTLSSPRRGLEEYHFNLTPQSGKAFLYLLYFYLE